MTADEARTLSNRHLIYVQDVLAEAQNAALRTERTPHVLFDATDRPVGQVLDDTVSLLDGEHIAARFREVEVVPQAGSLEAVVTVLRSAGAAADTTTASALDARAARRPCAALVTNQPG